VCGSAAVYARLCAAERTGVCAQCARQGASVRLVLYAGGSLQLSSSVRQCSSVSGSVWQCPLAIAQLIKCELSVSYPLTSGYMAGALIPPRGKMSG
jgi:hypothetical protein